MTMTLLLPWFPILLGVGVGGRLLGRRRGYALGLLCALFWIALLAASAQSGIWTDPWSLATVAAGVAAIIAIGGWAGETPLRQDSPTAESNEQAPAASRSNEHEVAFERIARVLDEFDDWLADHRTDNNPWPKFDEFLRGAMYQICQATHVRPYRVVGEGEQLASLCEPDPFTDAGAPPVRSGIVAQVVAGGRAYVAGDAFEPTAGRALGENSREPIVWCFAISQGTKRLGAVVVGRVDIDPQVHRRLLRTVEHLIQLAWCMLHEAAYSRSAMLDDPVSGLRTREAFLRAAGESLQESYAQGEPAAMAVIALERLRELNDVGRWDVADELVKAVGMTLRRKVRMDDQLGRFDGSRFIILLRRVDCDLASLIVAQIMSRLTALCGDEARWGAAIGVRCGLVGSGIGRPDLRVLAAGALGQARRARVESTPIASDFGPAALSVASSTRGTVVAGGDVERMSPVRGGGLRT